MIHYYMIYFTLMSFVGYVYECIAMTLWSGKWDNRGFLFGPVIPIYGLCCVMGLFVFGRYITSYSMFQVFMAGFIVSALVEYPTSYIMEKIFKTRWWDYSIGPWNINGRVSLLSSLGFGVAAVIIVFVINPYVAPFIFSLNPIMVRRISVFLMAIMAMDMAYTVYCLSKHKTPEVYDHLNERIENKVEELNPNQYSMYKVLKKRTNLFK